MRGCGFVTLKTPASREECAGPERAVGCSTRKAGAAKAASGHSLTRRYAVMPDVRMLPRNDA
jgi:hypothetical protein